MKTTKLIPLPHAGVQNLAQELGIHPNTLRDRWKKNDMEVIQAVGNYRERLKHEAEMAERKKQEIMQEAERE